MQFFVDTPRNNLWLDPGLGKTGIVLSGLDLLVMAGSNKFPALVLAPKRVARSVWTGERDKWQDFHNIRISQIVGTEKQRIAAFNQHADIFTINYENLPWLIDLLKGAWPFKTVIADESTRLKGFRLRRGSKRAAALAKVAKYTARWSNLTGTPAPNGLIDLWGQQWFIDAGARLGKSFTWFKQTWFNENEYSKEIKPRAFAEEQIMSNLADVTLSLRAEDCLDLPPIYHNPIAVELPAGAMKQYREFQREMVFEIENRVEMEAKTAADLSLKCLQLASGAYYTDESRRDWKKVHDAKLDALDSLLTELAGNPLLVAYHFKHDLQRLKKAFPEGRELKTQVEEERWNEGRYPVAFIHPASAGAGLNLQYGGHNLAFFSHWWDLEQYMQVIDRLGPVRQMQAGFDRRVGVHHIYAKGTLDEAVMERRQSKRSVQDSLRQWVKSGG